MKKTIKKQLEPLDFFEKLSEKEKNVSFLNTYTEEGWTPIIALNPSESFSAKTSKENIDKFKKFIKKHQQKENQLIGYISYETGAFLKKVKTKKSKSKLPDIFFHAYESHIKIEKNKITIAYKKPEQLKLIEEVINRPKTEQHFISDSKNFQEQITEKQYKDAYEKVIEYIKKGHIYQMNLTHQLEATTNLPARELFKRINQSNQVSYLAYIESRNFQILSASPELFLKIKKHQATTCPIKGTRKRGKNKAEDQLLKKELIESTKESAELNMITDLLRNDLGEVSEIGSVKLVGNRLISQCPTVWHTYSKITSKISPQISTIDALLSILPGGSITGCPKKRAIEIIEELEYSDRGVYTGIIGQIYPNSDLEFNIAIRTIVKEKKHLTLGIGGGIVIDSKEKSEFEETLQKAKSFMKILE